MKKITIIPARSGSKGLKNKNILELNEIPMFAWSVIHAKYYSSDEDIVVVSSDSEKYLEIANKYGATTHLRSNELSKDETFTEPVMEEVLKEYNLDDDDLVILLQPTSPIRKKNTLNNFINCFDNKTCDSALTVSNFHGFLWKDDKEFKEPLYSERPRRQDMEPKYMETGSIYGTKVKHFNKTLNRVSGNTAGVIVNFEESLEVDTQEEFNVIKSFFKDFIVEWEDSL